MKRPVSNVVICVLGFAVSMVCFSIAAVGVIDLITEGLRPGWGRCMGVLPGSVFLWFTYLAWRSRGPG